MDFDPLFALVDIASLYPCSSTIPFFAYSRNIAHNTVHVHVAVDDINWKVHDPDISSQFVMHDIVYI